MTEEDRIMLHDFLGRRKDGIVGLFDTWQDLGDLKEKLLSNGDWHVFYYWQLERFKKNGFHLGYLTSSSVCELIMRPETCQLVADFLKDSHDPA